MHQAKFIAALIAAAAPSLAAGLHQTSEQTLDNGYAQMYNLQFAEAHRTFQAWRAAHPDDPMAPVSDAAAYLFSEFDRLKILQSEFFTDDSGFRKRPNLTPDSNVRQAFLKQLDDCQRLANKALAHNAEDEKAQFANLLAIGLRSDYLAFIEKRYIASLSFMKTGRTLAQHLLARDPLFYDAYVAVGVENYMLGIKPAPMRWMLAITGSSTNKEQGLRELKLTAEKGHYLEPFARLLLAVASLRDGDKNKARDLLSGLTIEFPQNELYKRELARLQ